MQPVNLPVVSAFAAGLLIVAQMALMLNVALTRRRVGASLGNAGQPELERAVRRHGNFAENAAIFIAALSLVEMLGAQRWFVIALAAVFILGRVSHAIGLSMERTVNVWRVAGALATVGAGVALGVRLVTLALPHLG